jgi:NADH-quinone oxidoreductase subunit H
MFIPAKPKPEKPEVADGEDFDAFAGGFPVPPPMAVNTSSQSKEGSRG